MDRQDDSVGSVFVMPAAVILGVEVLAEKDCTGGGWTNTDRGSMGGGGAGAAVVETGLRDTGRLEDVRRRWPS